MAKAPVFSSNGGGTGLFEIPNARILPYGDYRVGVNQSHPYRWYHVSISPFSWLEFNGKLTEIIGVPALTKSYGNYKDKAFEFKLLLKKEDEVFPSIALGIMDPFGTRLYPSQYIVLSKNLYPFDITIGMGNGRFGKRPLVETGEGFKVEMLTDPVEWLKDSQIFWGVEFSPTGKWSLVLEYSPIKYHKQVKDPAQRKYFKKKVPSNYNIGFKFKPFRWSEFDISWQRGEELSFGFSVNFGLRKPFIPVYDIPYYEPTEVKKYSLEDRLKIALESVGFSSVQLVRNENVMYISLRNDRYLNYSKAIEKIAETIPPFIPDGVSFITLFFISYGNPLIKATINAEALKAIHEGVIPREDLWDFTEVSFDRSRMNYGRFFNSPFTGFKSRWSFMWKPSFETFLNDPSGFFKYRFGILAHFELMLLPGGSFAWAIGKYPINTISTLNKPLSIPVRSDLPFYKDEDTNLYCFLYNQVIPLPEDLFARFSLGILEIQYTGFDWELARSFGNGRLYVGIGGSYVKKRSENDPFGFKNEPIRKTIFLSTRLNLNELGINLETKAGRFLAGDKGISFTVFKKIGDVILGCWYTFTDTSVFKDNINRGYRDKGVFIQIPIQYLIGRPSRTVYNYSLSPWTRDTGQDIDHYRDLFGMFDEKYLRWR